MTALTIDTALQREAAKLLDERCEQMRAGISNGLLSHDDYKFRCGCLKGMEDAKAILDEAASNIAKR